MRRGEGEKKVGVYGLAGLARDAKLFLIRNNFNPLRPDVAVYGPLRATARQPRAAPYRERVRFFFLSFFFFFYVAPSFLSNEVRACFRSIMYTCYAVKRRELAPAKFAL